MAIDEYIDRVREGKTIIYNGLEFTQLKVRQIGLFHAAKQSFELLQSSLPPKYARYSWCECLDEMDKDAKEDGKTTAFLTLVLAVMAASLNLQPVGNNGNPTFPIREARDKNGHIVAIVILEVNNPVILNMKDMDEVRKIIAAQNLYEIPDESWNPDLVRARKYTASLKQSDIDFDIDDLVYSVAFNAHVKPTEIWDWPIRDFLKIQDAIDRTLNYQIFMTAEHSGFVKFNKGNPFPTWKYNRKPELPTEFKTVAELDAGAHGLLGVTTKQMA